MVQQPTGGDFPFPDGDLWALGVFLLATELGILIENMLASWPSAPSQSTLSEPPSPVWFCGHNCKGRRRSMEWFPRLPVQGLLLLSHFSHVGRTLCDPIDGSPAGSPIPGILQARTLEWVAISFSNASKWKVKVKLLSRVRPSAIHGLQPSRLLCPWDFPGKSTGVGCHCLLQSKG